MKFELEKGTLGYIKKKKKRHAGMVLLLLLIGAIIMITGLIINKFDKANICTVLSILMVLPAAKNLVLLIVVFPYKSVTKERYDKIASLVNDNTILMTDMVITSPEEVMNLDFVVITDNQVLGLIGKKKQKEDVVEKYIEETLKANKLDGFTVKVFREEEKFISCIPNREFECTSAMEECYKLIRTLIV